jgi:hypothetical protein
LSFIFIYTVVGREMVEEGSGYLGVGGEVKENKKCEEGWVGEEKQGMERACAIIKNGFIK